MITFGDGGGGLGSDRINGVPADDDQPLRTPGSLFIAGKGGMCLGDPDQIRIVTNVACSIISFHGCLYFLGYGCVRSNENARDLFQQETQLIITARSE